MAVHDFTTRWLAECLRAEAIEPEWHRAGMRSPPPDVDGEEPAVLAWVAIQPEAEAMGNQLKRWRRRAGWALSLGALLIALSALVGAWSVLGDGSRPVNTLWTVLLLLGVPTLSLIGALLLGLRQREGGFALGATAWNGLRWLGRFGSPGVAAEALTLLLARAGVLPRVFAALSHLLWSAALGGAVLGLVLAFSLRSYQFVWQTTVLPDSVFIAVVQALGQFPGWLGFAQPSADMIAASGVNGVEDLPVRRAWASWLIGVLCVFGLLPRLLLTTIEAARCQRALRAVSLPIHEPFYQQLLRKRAQLRSVILAGQGKATLPNLQFQRHPGGGRGAWLVGLELPATRVLPSAGGAAQTLRVDERDERGRLLERLRAQPAQRLLFAVEARQSPDRSLGGMMSEASRFSAQTAVWLLDLATVPAERATVWREVLEAAGLPTSLQFATQTQALAWLAGDAR